MGKASLHTKLHIVYLLYVIIFIVTHKTGPGVTVNGPKYSATGSCQSDNKHVWSYFEKYRRKHKNIIF